MGTSNSMLTNAVQNYIKTLILIDSIAILEISKHSQHPLLLSGKKIRKNKVKSLKFTFLNGKIL